MLIKTTSLCQEEESRKHIQLMVSRTQPGNGLMFQKLKQLLFLKEKREILETKVLMEKFGD